MALEKGLSEHGVLGAAQALAVKDGHWAIRCTLEGSGKFRVWPNAYSDSLGPWGRPLPSQSTSVSI